jgi:epoxyqueuosine reductase
MNTSQISEFIKSEAKKIGFFECGISKAHQLEEDEARMEAWLKKGMHGTMSYLEKNKTKRYDPSRLVEGAKSVITVLYNYFPDQKLPESDSYRISKYAYGKDYHFVVKKKLALLLSAIEDKTGAREARLFVDSAPVLDRAWARESGLGFIGKNTLLINRKGGSFFFIGHIICDLELTYDETDYKNYCGTCTKCVDACPTQAIEAFQVDARKCISYLTIENRDEIPEMYQDKLNNWIFGCDICQDVCPWNKFAKPHHEPLFNPSDNLINMEKNNWEQLEKPVFNSLFRNSALQRTGFKGLKRNIKFVSEKS